MNKSPRVWFILEQMLGDSYLCNGEVTTVHDNFSIDCK